MRRFALAAVATLLTACGGGGGSGGSGTSLATGYFKDSNTQGLRYVAGGQAGVTGADGSFTYEVGRPVSFYIGSGTGPLTAYGLYTFDIDASNNVTGVAYDIASDSLETLTGTVSGGSATTLSGVIGTGGTFSATVNLAAGTVSAAIWSKGAVSGNFTASGCQLN